VSQASYRAGIIGLGFIGAADQTSGDALGQQVENLDGTHLGALAGNPRIRLVAGSSRDPGRRSRFEERAGVGSYADWREMIAAEGLDLVSVATYTPVHEEITVACARAGIRAIYCEKPLASRVSEGDRMLQACRESGSLLAVNHNRRFHPNYRRLRDLIDDGGLGELTSINLQWSSGRLGNVGTHLFDALYMVTGRRVEAISGTLDLSGKPDCRGPAFQDPGGWGLMRLEGGVMVTVDASDYARVPMSLSLNGSEGRALTGGDEVLLEYWDGRQERWPGQRDQATGMDRAVREIVAWLDGSGPFAYDAGEAVYVLESIVAFHVSHDRSGAWTELPLKGADRDRRLNSG
jgi:predicted dehydrogenase